MENLTFLNFFSCSKSVLKILALQNFSAKKISLKNVPHVGANPNF